MATNERGSDERRSGGGTPPGQGITGSATPCGEAGAAPGGEEREGTLRLFNPAKVRRGFIQDRIFALVVCCRLSLCGPDPLAASKKSSTRTLKPVLWGMVGWRTTGLRVHRAGRRAARHLLSPIGRPGWRRRPRPRVSPHNPTPLFTPSKRLPRLHALPPPDCPSKP